MSKSKRGIDARQLTLDGYLVIPAQPDETTGRLNLSDWLCLNLATALKQSSRDRFEVAAEMSRLTGDQISKAQVDAWTAKSKPKWRFPAEYLPAFVQATDSYWLLDKFATFVGCRVLVGEDKILSELGELSLKKQRLERQEQSLKYMLAGRAGDSQ